jgi:hypothetical protein
MEEEASVEGEGWRSYVLGIALSIPVGLLLARSLGVWLGEWRDSFLWQALPWSVLIAGWVLLILWFRGRHPPEG